MEASRPKISICVANYNGLGVIDECLTSVLNQRIEVEFEVIVHDDASTDESVDRISTRYPQVTLIASSENVGYCVANNRMVARARGQYVLLLNNDAWLAPDALETLLRTAEIRGDAIFTLPQYHADSGDLLDCGLFLDVLSYPIPVGQVAAQPVAMVMGACLWVTRELWCECGGFPEWFGSLAEDLYLCCYARTMGYPVEALAESAYYHHVGHSFGGGKVVASQLRTTVLRRRLSERNKLYVMFLFYPLPALCLLLPLLLLILFAEGMVLSLIKWDFSIFTGIYGFALGSFIKNFASLSRRRVLIQRRRAVGLGVFFSVYRWFPQKLRLLLKHGVPELQ